MFESYTIRTFFIHCLFYTEFMNKPDIVNILLTYIVHSFQ